MKTYLLFAVPLLALVVILTLSDRYEILLGVMTIVLACASLYVIARVFRWIVLTLTAITRWRDRELAK
jgi:hypothetical protein